MLNHVNCTWTGMRAPQLFALRDDERILRDPFLYFCVHFMKSKARIHSII